jgi:hypothetical protein
MRSSSHQGNPRVRRAVFGISAGSGLNASVEVQYAGKIYVNDRDTDFLVGVSPYATF